MWYNLSIFYSARFGDYHPRQKEMGEYLNKANCPPRSESPIEKESWDIYLNCRHFLHILKKKFLSNSPPGFYNKKSGKT